MSDVTAAKPPTILVIDDDTTVCQYIKRRIEEQLWACDLDVDGEAGEARATSEANDLKITPASKKVRNAYPLYGGIQNFR